MGPGNDATNLAMGPANGLRPTASGQAGPEEVSTDYVRQPRPKAVLRASAAHSSGRISSIEVSSYLLAKMSHQVASLTCIG